MLAAHSFGQDSTSKTQPTPDEYQQKSRSQKVAGFIFLGVGITTLAVISRGQTDFDVLPVLALGGVAATVASIPLFFSAAKNKRKAMSLTVKKEKAFIPRYGGITQKSFPALTLKLNLN
jgi:hypothetical protein